MADRIENTSQDLKGRAKEAVGAATDDQDLKNEGKLDQTKASLKDKVDDLGDEIKSKLD